jgi:hypothetical protein
MMTARNSFDIEPTVSERAQYWELELNSKRLVTRRARGLATTAVLVGW